MINGTYGRGTFSALSLNTDTNNVMMGSGEEISINNIIKQFNESWTTGYLLQKMLEPHPEVEKLVGNRVSSLRIVILLTKSGPKLHRAVWKFPTGNNMSDNFMHGETGNLIANVQLDNGMIDKPITGIGDKIKYVVQHPDTKINLSQQSVPMWEDVKELPDYPQFTAMFWKY